MVKHFRELRVYRDAFESAMRIFEQVREDGVEYEVTEDLTYPHTHTPTNPGRTSNPTQS